LGQNLGSTYDIIVFVGQCQLLRRGAFAEVFEGTKKGSNEKVAIKVIRKQYVRNTKNLQREIDIMKAVSLLAAL
jgi:serine/threonine protein kinase